MESNKTEVLSFDIDKYNSRECQVHNHGFYLGEQSKQDEIDELQRKFDYSERLRSNQFEHLKEITAQRDMAQRVNHELKKRIDEVMYDLQHIESAMWEEQVEHVLMILKGEETK